MPWEVIGTCVHKKGSDKPIPGGCHDTAVEAEAHVRALYASEPEAGKSWSQRNRQPTPVNSVTPGFVVKEINGEYRWVLISSSAFEDRDGEIVSSKALQADVDRADSDGDFGPLRWWHLPGADIGDCDFNMLHGRMLYESGTFRDRRVAEAVKEHAGELGASIGFTHPVSEPDSNGVFHNIRRFERSLLPRELASNPFTAVSLVEKESQMTSIEDKLKAFGHILKGDAEMVSQVLAIGALKESEAIAAGTRHKEKQECESGYHWDEETQACVKDAPDEVTPDEVAPPPVAEKKETVGDMAPAELAALINSAIANNAGSLKAELQSQLDTHTATKEASEKAYAESVKALDTKLEAIAASATSALEGVKELKGELPRALGERLKGYRASAEGDAPPDIYQDAQPRPDPVDKMLASLKAAQGGNGYQG